MTGAARGAPLVLGFGALAGAQALVLLDVSTAALGLESSLALGPLWLLGLGLGFWFQALGHGRLGPLMAGLWLTALVLPLGIWAVESPARDWFWDAVDGSRLASVGLWQVQVVAAGVVLGGAMGSRFAVAGLGFGLGAGLVQQWSGQRFDLLAPLVALGFCLWLVGDLGARWTRFRMRKIVALKVDNVLLGGQAEQPVLRPRLVGVVLFVALATSLVTALVSDNILELCGQLGAGARLSASGLCFSLGVLLGRLFIPLTKRFARAELSPLCLLIAASVWITTRGVSVEFVQSDELPRFAIDVLRAGLWIGPSALCAGAAISFLPSLAFLPTTAGKRRGQQLIATTIMALGLLAVPTVAERIFVNPGPGPFLASLVLLAAVTIFLVADLRRQAVGVVGVIPDRMRAVFTTGLRSLTGGVLVALSLGLVGRSSVFEQYPGRLIRALVDVEASRLVVESGGHRLRLEQRDWVHDAQRIHNMAGPQVGQNELGEVALAAQRLGALIGLSQPVDLVRRGAPRKGDGWPLDVSLGSAGGRGGSAAAFGQLRFGSSGLVGAWLPLNLKIDAFGAAMDSFGGCFDFATLWLVDGRCLLLGADYEWQLDLTGGARARRAAASFVGILVNDQRVQVDQDWELELPGVLGSDPGRALVRNLETLASRRTPMPARWQSLLGDFPEGQLARALIEMRLAAAWVDYDRRVAPGSIALESWLVRFADARLKAGLLGTSDPELLRFDIRVQAESDLAAAQAKLRAGDPRGAVALLLGAREVLVSRGDVEVALATAFELAGNHAAARLTWRALGARGPALLGGSEAWLCELGEDGQLGFARAE